MKPLRKIEPGGYRVTQILKVEPGNEGEQVEFEIPGDDVRAWLVEQAKKHSLTALLAHADDGVIWGQVTDTGLQTSHEVFDDLPSPELRVETLQQARLFGEKADLLLWRTAKGWRARLVEDDLDAGEHYDQPQLLWGNRYVTSCEGFTLVEEGRQGLRHAPPVTAPQTEFDDERHPLRLHVRHYLATATGTGVVDVVLSRLVQVDYEPRAVKKKEVAS